MEWVQYLKGNCVPFEDMPYSAQVLAKTIGKEYFRYLSSGFGGWVNPVCVFGGFHDVDVYRLAPNYKSRDIEITVKVNGKHTKLSDISEETLLKIREEN